MKKNTNRKLRMQKRKFRQTQILSSRKTNQQGMRKLPRVKNYPLNCLIPMKLVQDPIYYGNRKILYNPQILH